MRADRKYGRVFALSAGLLAATSAWAGDNMPVARQNALVHQYCAVCHTDGNPNGGLSLEHFDGASAAPSLAAMMVSKLTGGASLATARTIATDPKAAALVAERSKTGAMGAAGIPIPDKPTIDALIAALTAEANGDLDWHVDPEHVVTASILREVTGTSGAGTAEMYRLVVACDPVGRIGEMRVSWSPAPKLGALTVIVDGATPQTYQAEATESMATGGQAAASGATARLSSAGPLPARTLTSGYLFPGQTVEFPFSNLPQAARQSLAACFSAGK